MRGGIGAYIASEVSGAIRRNVIVFGLQAFAVVLVFCAGGYALSALHSVLAIHYGMVQASLFIAGGLLFAALVAFGGAMYVKSRRRPARPMAATALVAAPFAAKLIGSGMKSGGISWRMAAVAGVVVVGALLGRQFFTGGDAGDDEI